MTSRTHRLAGRGILVVAVTACGVAAALLAGAARADAASVSGRVTGTPIPKAGAGESFVRAVNLLTGEIAAVDATDRAGRYRMTVPKGAFALFPTVVTRDRVLAPKPTAVRLRKGQARSVRLRARPSAVVLRPIVALPDDAFTGAPAASRFLHRGLRDMLITDLLGVKTASCDLTLVERSARFTAARTLELALARRGLVDPATAIRAGGLITPTRGVRGTITIAGGRMRIDAQVYRWGSGKTLGRTGVEGAEAEFFELEALLARRVAALLCEQPPPISGTFTGSLDYARVIPVGALVGSLEWSGSLDLEPQPTTAGLPPGFGGGVTPYRVGSGSVTARIHLVPAAGGCTISGQVTYDVVASLGGAPVQVMVATEGDPDTYGLALDGGLARIPIVLSACPAGQETSNGRTGEWPLLGIGLLPFTQTVSVATDGVFSGAATGSTPGTDDGYRWTWSLRG